MSTVNTRLTYLDGLRGFAVLYVIAFHLALVPSVKPPVPAWMSSLVMFGGSGVVLFFVISAFSLSYSMKRHLAGGHMIESYAISRICRIIPLFYFMMAFTYVLHVNLFGVWHSPVEVIMSAVLLFNLIPSFQEGFVWASWTIGVEVLFYCVFPILYVWQESWPKRISLFLAALSFWILYKGILVPFVSDVDRASFENFSVFRYFPVFLIGMSAYAMYSSPVLRGHLEAYSMVAICGGVLGLIGVASGRITNGIFDTVHVTGISYAAIILGCSARKIKIIDNKILTNLGKISFSMYLIHAPAIWIMAPLYEKINQMRALDTVKYSVSLLITVSVVASVSWLTYRVIERPFMEWGARVIAHRSARRAGY